MLWGYTLQHHAHCSRSTRRGSARCTARLRLHPLSLLQVFQQQQGRSGLLLTDRVLALQKEIQIYSIWRDGRGWLYSYWGIFGTAWRYVQGRSSSIIGANLGSGDRKKWHLPHPTKGLAFLVFRRSRCVLPLWWTPAPLQPKQRRPVRT